MNEKDADNPSEIEGLKAKLEQLEKDAGIETENNIMGIKKYKKLTFSFSILSLLGFVFGFAFASESYGGFAWAMWFGTWLTFSVPLIVLWIYTKVFD